MTFGLALILVVLCGYLSNWLNWRFLNHRIVRLSYYVGAFVHEGSHALVCLLTGARIKEFTAFSSEPHVTHGKSKIPLIGGSLISIAPLFGGLLFLWLVNGYLLGTSFVFPSGTTGWSGPIVDAIGLLSQLRPLEWQSWVMALLFLNVGAMIGPSLQDMRNIWPALIVLLFVSSSTLTGFCLMALSLILINIMIQLALIGVSRLVGMVYRGA
jgi:hypothetical protein